MASVSLTHLVCHRGRIVEDGPDGTGLGAPRAEYSRSLLKAHFDLSPRNRTRPLPSGDPKGAGPRPSGPPSRTTAAGLRTLTGSSKHFSTWRQGTAGGRRPRCGVLDGIDLRVSKANDVALVGRGGIGKIHTPAHRGRSRTADGGDVARAGDVALHVVFQDAVASADPLRSRGPQIAERCAVCRPRRDGRAYARALEEVALDPALAAALASEASRAGNASA